jgi:hypothetical protein
MDQYLKFSNKIAKHQIMNLVPLDRLSSISCFFNILDGVGLRVGMGYLIRVIYVS